MKRKWIILFPEGGFLRKRRQRSQEYMHFYHIRASQGCQRMESLSEAEKTHFLLVMLNTKRSALVRFVQKVDTLFCRFARKNGYPILNNVVLPRVGALGTILNTLPKQQVSYQNGSSGVSGQNSGQCRYDSIPLNGNGFFLVSFSQHPSSVPLPRPQPRW